MKHLFYFIRYSLYTILFFSFSSYSQQSAINQKNKSSEQYYISNNGNDNNDGSEGSPWKTISHAVNQVTSGTIHVASGIYSESVVLKKSGTSDEYITLLGDGGAVIDGSFGYNNADYGLLTVLNASYVIIDNITVRNALTHGIMVIGNCNNIIIQNCTTEHTRGSGINAQGNFGYPWDKKYHISNLILDNNEILWPQEGRFDGNNIWHEDITLRQGVEYFEIKNNHVKAQENEAWDGGPLGIDVKDGVRHGSVHHNHIENIPSGGIYVDAWETLAEDIEIYNNKVHHIKGDGIEIGAERGGPINNISVYNNIIYNTDWHGIASGDYTGDNITPQPKTHINIYNNTIYNVCINGEGWASGIHTGKSFQEGKVFNNIIFDTNKCDIFKINTDNNNFYSNNLTEDPLFVDADNNNFKLMSDSPAIDSGLSEGAPSFDFNGNNRPYGNSFDIGAYEYNGVLSINSINKKHSVNTISIFPNPSSKLISLKYTLSKETSVKLVIYNITGNEIKTLVNKNQFKGTHIIKLNTEDLKIGIYFINLQTKSYQSSTKFLIK